jgi:hypothetical protein
MCFRSASDAVYSCISASASSRVILTSGLWRLGISGREGNAISDLTVEADLEGVLSRVGQWDIKNEHRARLYVYDAGRRFTELHCAFATQQFVAGFVHEANADGVHPDLGTPAPDPEHQVGTRIDRGKVREPDVLKHAEDTELPLLINQGVVGNYRKIEMQFRRPVWMSRRRSAESG